MLSRQKNWTAVFCGQNSRDIDESILRQINTVVFKEPGLNAASERPEIRSKAIIAKEAFGKIPKDERRELALVFDESGFEGFIRCSLPSFWSEKLSTVYGRLNPVEFNKRNIFNSSGPSENRGAKLLSVAVSDEEILALRRQGFGIEKISKELGCTTYRVRQSLAGQDPINESES